MKQLRHAISLIFKDGERVFVVKRSEHEKVLPGLWSLPSSYVHDGETDQETAERLCRAKLGIDGVVISKSPVATSPIAEKTDFLLEMKDYEVVSYDGVITIHPTDYTESKWLTARELLSLLTTENKGDMGECTKAFLLAEGLL